VSDTTRNLGGGAAPATSTWYFLSANNLLDAGDVAIGSRAVGALAAGASDSGTATLTIPAGTASGTYYVIARADGNDALVETQEGNNTYLATITVGADLVVSTLTVPTDGGSGLAITLGDTTRNQGSSVAAASVTTYYLSANGVLDSGDFVLGSRPVAPLGAGASDSGTITVTLPAGLATGTYYVFAKADGGNAIVEVSEANNTASRSIRLGPDLAVSAFTSPASVAAGATFTVSDTTRNQGGGSAPSSTTRYYLSANNVLDTSDVALGARAVAALGPGVSDAGSVTLAIPPGTAARYYYLFARADADDGIVETQEGNNTYAVVIQVTP
jgi:subtilase family serine protease